MSTRKKTYGFLILVTLIGAASYGLLSYFGPDTAQAASDDQAAAGKTEEGVPVETSDAYTGSISYQVVSTANLRPKRKVSVASRTEGVVEQIHVEEGDYVDSGKLLCQLDATKYEIQLQSARQKLAQAKLQLEKARILQDKSRVQVKNTNEEYKRYKKLYEERLVSEREVAEVGYRLEELRHDLRVSSSESQELGHRVEELEAEIQQAELEISRTQVRAPFSGYVVERSINIGQTVKNLDPLFELGDFKPLLVDVFLSEKEAGQITSGQLALITSGINSSITVIGEVARVSPVVDESTGTVKVTAELNQRNSLLKPGAFVHVAIETDTRHNSILIPKRAIIEEDEGKFVFVAEEDTAKKVPIETGYESNGAVEVIEGIASGESVIVAGQGGLKEGSKIRRMTEPEDSSDA